MIPPSSLPEPSRDRWQPLRSGLINLFKFDNEEFWYERGHLLLRGNNGTGKSRVLALQLPFLLDGDARPTRVEPDQDGHKRMEWNLLMNRHQDRLGYSWLEFGRTENDLAHYLTIGCGMRAVQGRSGVRTWFFVTRKRVGADLHLVTSEGRPLVRERLAAEIGDEGEVFDTAKAYRQAIDEALFKLGADRYRALVDLLLQLRRPQLSRQLDEQHLSAALSEALTPVDETIITDVADAMSALERDQDELDRFKSTRQGVEAFMDSYQRYARIAARRAAAPVRNRHYEYEEAARNLRVAEGKLETALAELQDVDNRLEQLETELEQAEARVEALLESPEMRKADELRRAEEDAAQRRNESEVAASDHRESLSAVKNRELDLTKSSAEADQHRLSVVEAGHGAESSADLVGLASGHRDAVTSLDLDDLIETEAIDEPRTLIESAVRQRREGAKHLRELHAQVAEAEAKVHAAQRRYDEESARLDDAIAEQREASRAVGEACRQMTIAYRQWSAAATVPEPADPDEVAAQLEAWCDDPTGRNPVDQAASDALASTLRSLAESRAAATARLGGLDEELEERRSLLNHLEAGRHIAPAAPHTRDADARADLPGGPLWKLVDFSDALPEEERAGLEAALEASGLLDAWLTPDGRLLDPELRDTFLGVGTDLAQQPVSSLNDVLVPAPGIDAGAPPIVEPEVIRSMLRQIGYGETVAANWVASSGRWRLGPLVGRWSKVSAQHVGAEAREADRERRMLELRDQMAALSTSMEKCRNELREIEDREKATREHARASPSDAALRGALARVEIVAGQLVQHRDRLEEAEQILADRRQDRDSLRVKRDDDARDLDLIQWVDDPQGLIDSLAEYERALARLWPTIGAYAVASRQVRRDRDLVDEARDVAARNHQRAAQARRQADAAQARHRALEETATDEITEVVEKCEAAKQRVKVIRDSIAEAHQRKVNASERKAGGEANCERFKETQQQCDQERADAIDGLRRFITSGLLEVADGAFESFDASDEWSPTRGVEVARRVDARLGQTDDADRAWQRAQSEVLSQIETLKNSLGPQGHPPQNDPTIDNHYVVTVPFQGQTLSMPELGRILANEIVERQGILDAKEREVIENCLIDEVASHLHDRLLDGEQLVRNVNLELEGRATSTGMELRFKWDLPTDGPEDLIAARRQLIRNPDVQTPEEREALAQFLQRQIKEARETNDLGTWRDHLREALDYRAWHRFQVLRRDGERYVPLTRRTHGTGSGGEKALALTIPQFAAASAHYYSADPAAPRMIMLDEAFVGIDPEMRSHCMGLLEAFDLDFVMTSESEWGCYPTLHGNAIYQLSTRPELDAVLCTRWVWNGKERRQDAAPNAMANGLPNAVPNSDGQSDGHLTAESEQTLFSSGTANS